MKGQLKKRQEKMNRKEYKGLVLPLTAASSSETRKTASRSVAILADSKAVTELQRNQNVKFTSMIKGKCNKLQCMILV